jgi:hypothetical protein
MAAKIRCAKAWDDTAEVDQLEFSGGSETMAVSILTDIERRAEKA